MHKLVILEKNVMLPLLRTLYLGVLFLAVQVSEYRVASFSISDSVFGNTFFLLTGFHGFHVFLGLILLRISFVTTMARVKGRHTGLICSI